MLVRAVAVVSASLAATSARNMAQTHFLSREATNTSKKQCDAPILNFSRDSSVEDVVSHLQQLKRKELLELYLASDAPAEPSIISGEWHTLLVVLDNNGWVMVSEIEKLMSRSVTLFYRVKKFKS